MKTTLSILILSLGLLAAAASAQSSIDWFTVDGGGGTSTGGFYSGSGTIGQPDAGKMSGGNYTLDGGFWGIIGAVQTPGAPALRVFLTSTNTVNAAGGENQVIVSPPAGNRFYRLKYQP